MTKYIYHMVPKKLSGTTLMPLFSLRDKCPQTFEQAISKYDDHPKRKELPLKDVPVLNCKRGEVLQFSPIHPYLIYEKYCEVFGRDRRPLEFYEIPLSSLDNGKVVMFDMNVDAYQFGLDKDPIECFSLIDTQGHSDLIPVPNAVRDFYQDWKDRGFNSAPLFGKVPHFFYRGEVDISDCRIINWQDRP